MRRPDDDPEYLWHSHYDKFHKVVRDLKNAGNRSMNGVYVRNLMRTSFVWSLNYRPFSSGQWEHEKRSMLNKFLQRHNSTSALFRKWAPLIAMALGMPLASESDYDDLFGMLSRLASFNSKGPLTKLMRWFSYNSQCEFHLPEFFALAMILEDANGPQYSAMPAEQDPAQARPSYPVAELRQLRATLGQEQPHCFPEGIPRAIAESWHA
jgi:hypothetical protein